MIIEQMNVPVGYGLRSSSGRYDALGWIQRTLHMCYVYSRLPKVSGIGPKFSQNHELVGARLSSFY